MKTFTSSSSSSRRLRALQQHVGGGIFLVLLLLQPQTAVFADVIISEIADKGTTSSGTCNGNDWLELHNTDPENDADLTGYMLHDDKGMTINENEDLFIFPSGSVLGAGEYGVVCCGGDATAAVFGGEQVSAQFKIGGSDTITLRDTLGGLLDSVGPLPDAGGVDITYAWNEAAASASTSMDMPLYAYTSSPTPGQPNWFTGTNTDTDPSPNTPSSTISLEAQNDEGTDFFGMDLRGYPVGPYQDEVLDLYIEMDEPEFQYLQRNASYEVYSNFQRARVVRRNGEVLQELSSPGRIRPKGQFTRYMGTCLGSLAIPYQLDFDKFDKSQTLFGMEKAYLRNHFRDNSYMRDWVAHRMLARFELPYVRARKVGFYINDQKIGFYTLMEAVDQDYVFARNFPNYQPDNYALYKVKTMARDCGAYKSYDLRRSRSRVDDPSIPPYNFERGEHREIIQSPPVYGFGGPPELDPNRYSRCQGMFQPFFRGEFEHVRIAYLRANESCPSMLVDQGLIDRDLGDKKWDDTMKQFIGDHLEALTSTDCDYNDNSCRQDQQKSTLVQEMDVENVLKNFAVYAATLNTDSPMGNGNNYYLANGGDGKGWKIMQYDHNWAGSNCAPRECNSRLVYWSILHPTCRAYVGSNALVGPFLNNNPTLQARYIEHVRTFVDEIMGNTSFVEEMQRHAQTIREDVKSDPWSNNGRDFINNELSPDAAMWNARRYPLLPLYKKRVEVIRAQLKAIDNGSFNDNVYNPSGNCMDWRTQQYY